MTSVADNCAKRGQYGHAGIRDYSHWLDEFFYASSTGRDAVPIVVPGHAYTEEPPHIVYFERVGNGTVA